MSTQTDQVQIVDHETEKVVHIDDIAIDPITWQSIQVKDKQQMAQIAQLENHVDLQNK